MKLSLHLFVTAAALATASSARAQILPDAVPWITQTATRLTTAFDANGDGLSDVLDLNREQGSFTLGLRQANGTYLWSPPRSVGFSQVETMAAGKFISPTAMSLMVTSRDFNNVQPVPLDGSDLPEMLKGFAPPEPQALATVPVSSGPQAVAVGYAGNTANPLYYHITGQSFSYWQDYNLAANARHAGTIHLRSGAAPVIAVMGNTDPEGSARVQIFRADENGSDYVTEWSGLPVDSRFVPGFFLPDLASQTASYQSATLVSWVPGSAMLRIARLTSHDLANNMSYEDLTFEPLPFPFNMQRPLRSVHVLYKPGGHRLLLTYSDAAGGAAIYDFDGTNVPELIEGLALNGLDLDAITSLPNGEFLASGSRNGQPAYDLYTESSPGHYTAAATGALPGPVPNQAFYSNIVAFSGEPFVNTSATAVKRARVADWTTGGTAPNTTGAPATVNTLTDNGSSTGLGNPGSTNLDVPQNTTHLLFSQITPMTSIAFTSAKSVHQSQMPAPQFQPAGGQYPPLGAGENMPVVIEVPGGGFDITIQYSQDGGPWQYASRFEPILLTGPATFRAFAYSYLTGMSSIITASYTFAPLPPMAAQASTDANMNGLSDDWEDLTGITDPAADDDNDGLLNLAEHNAGYDPNDANSQPAVVTTAPQLNLVNSTNVSTPHTLKWDASDTAILLETSADLQSWTLVTHGTRVEGNQRVFDLPTNSFIRRFYRLRR